MMEALSVNFMRIGEHWKPEFFLCIMFINGKSGWKTILCKKQQARFLQPCPPFIL